MYLLSRIVTAVAIPLVAGGAATASNVTTNNQVDSGRRHDDLVQEVHRSSPSVFKIQTAGSASTNSSDDNSVSNILPAAVINSNQSVLEDNSTLNNTQGFEVEVEHGVTTLKPHGGAGETSSVNSVDDNSVDSSGLEVEIEHGVTTLVPHGGDDSVVGSSVDSSTSIDSNSGLEVEIEHGVTTLVPHGGDQAVSNGGSATFIQDSSLNNSGSGNSGSGSSDSSHGQNRRGRGQG